MVAALVERRLSSSVRVKFLKTSCVGIKRRRFRMYFGVTGGGFGLGDKTTSERLVTFSDAVFAVIITIMVLDLKPPDEATLPALWPMTCIRRSMARFGRRRHG